MYHLWCARGPWVELTLFYSYLFILTYFRKLELRNHLYLTDFIA